MHITRLIALLRTLEGAASTAAEDVAEGMAQADATDAVLEAAGNLRGFLDDAINKRAGEGPPPFHGDFTGVPAIDFAPDPRAAFLDALKQPVERVGGGSIPPPAVPSRYARARATFDEAIGRSRNGWMPALDAQSAREMCERVDQLELDLEMARAEIASTHATLGIFHAQVTAVTRGWVAPLLVEMDTAMECVADRRPIVPNDVAQRLEAARAVSAR